MVQRRELLHPILSPCIAPLLLLSCALALTRTTGFGAGKCASCCDWSSQYATVCVCVCVCARARARTCV